ncbi:hypothetical protein DXG03_005727 [Asterophora parasitica]|uniref:Uncharacterized protein n=1 Tax=Asterophora parasitica TaxID=117018 RepID=A0A9P7G9T1_9AGAR|nr:hypothetical protein DXG03_005727 [Asterophora parasitica]
MAIASNSISQYISVSNETTKNDFYNISPARQKGEKKPKFDVPDNNAVKGSDIYKRVAAEDTDNSFDFAELTHGEDADGPIVVAQVDSSEDAVANRARVRKAVLSHSLDSIELLKQDIKVLQQHNLAVWQEQREIARERIEEITRELTGQEHVFRREVSTSVYTSSSPVVKSLCQRDFLLNIVDQAPAPLGDSTGSIFGDDVVDTPYKLEKERSTLERFVGTLEKLIGGHEGKYTCSSG